MRKESLYKVLVSRYIEDKASDKEREVFFHLLAKGKLDKHLHEAMEASARKALGESDDLMPAILHSGRSPWPARVRWLAAAMLIGVVSVSALLFLGKGSKGAEKQISTSVYKNEISAGGNHALLTLANGATIALDNTKGKDNLGMQGNARVEKINAGNLVYQATAGKTTAVYYNTVATPAGGQYRVTLADGTQVWLNALSTLRFPTSFNGADRTVQLTGEAYFEVAKNKSNPFHVKVNGVDVAVLGTSFNVNAYSDEGALKTTLVEGSVQLSKGGKSLMLSPGQQGSQDDRVDGFTLVKAADVGQAVAWKNGYFSFDDVDIRGVMRQLARWYGIQVKYEGVPTSAQFWGKMGRDLNLTQVLNGLTKSKVHFKLEGTLLTVLP
jgi:transmembrane sensor